MFWKETPCKRLENPVKLHHCLQNYLLQREQATKILVHCETAPCLMLYIRKIIQRSNNRIENINLRNTRILFCGPCQ